MMHTITCMGCGYPSKKALENPGPITRADCPKCGRPTSHHVAIEPPKPLPPPPEHPRLFSDD
jgi:predicted nucleic-acid-binding Zn-ribbon protein